MCLATSANDETWTSSKHISVLEAPLFGATVVEAVSAAVGGVSSPDLFSTAATLFGTSDFKTAGGAACA